MWVHDEEQRLRNEVNKYEMAVQYMKDCEENRICTFHVIDDYEMAAREVFGDSAVNRARQKSTSNNRGGEAEKAYSDIQRMIELFRT